MSNKKIRSILKDVLEEEIPSSQVNLWPAVKADLVAGKYQQNQQGDKTLVSGNCSTSKTDMGWIEP